MQKTHGGYGGYGLWRLIVKIYCLINQPFCRTYTAKSKLYSLKRICEKSGYSPIGFANRFFIFYVTYAFDSIGI